MAIEQLPACFFPSRRPFLLPLEIGILIFSSFDALSSRCGTFPERKGSHCQSVSQSVRPQFFTAPARPSVNHCCRSSVASLIKSSRSRAPLDRYPPPVAHRGPDLAQNETVVAIPASFRLLLSSLPLTGMKYAGRCISQPEPEPCQLVTKLLCICMHHML